MASTFITSTAIPTATLTSTPSLDINDIDTNNNNNRHSNPDAPKASATFFLTIVLCILLLCLFYHLFYIYIIRRAPYFYSVQSDIDPTLWHVERIVPLRERIRQWRNLPRSDSDVFRDEDLLRVRTALMCKGWRGRVNSDGTPNKNHRVVDDRVAGYGGYSSRVGGYNRDVVIVDEEYGPRQYIETEDTPFWRERRWGCEIDAKGKAGYGSKARGSSPFRNYGSFATSPIFFHNGGLSSSKWPAGVSTPDMLCSSASPTGIRINSINSTNNNNNNMNSKEYSHLQAAFSYHASPRNTNFVTPPIRASSKILEALDHHTAGGLKVRYNTDRSARFPDEDLQDHYVGLCLAEDEALKALEDARTAAAVERTQLYSTNNNNKSNTDGADHARRVIEKLTRLEKKLLAAVKRRSVFVERFAVKHTEEGNGEEGSMSRIGSVVSGRGPPPPYTDVEDSGFEIVI